LAKYVLDTKADDFNFLLIGIGCSNNQYVLANAINEVLQIDLRLENYIDLSHKMGTDFKFSFYSFLDEEFNIEYNLIPNRSNNSENTKHKDLGSNLFSAFNESIDESSRLIPELTKTDFLLLVKGDEFYHYSYKITDALKKISDIISIQEIIPEELNSKNNLIF
jgi:hypothetical protein